MDKMSNQTVTENGRPSHMSTGQARVAPGPFLPVSYARIQRSLERCSEAVGLSQCHFTSHSLRRGGATRLLIQGWKLADIAFHGRWKNQRSCYEYLRRGQAFLMRAREAVDADWASIDFWAEHLSEVIRMFANR